MGPPGPVSKQSDLFDLARIVRDDIERLLRVGRHTSLFIIGSARSTISSCNRAVNL
jgi:hypothetical protein